MGLLSRKEEKKMKKELRASDDGMLLKSDALKRKAFDARDLELK